MEFEILPWTINMILPAVLLLVVLFIDPREGTLAANRNRCTKPDS